ncbi:MAG: cell division protein FtsQ/DivIB, partial [Bacteroidales bacterium]
INLITEKELLEIVRSSTPSLVGSRVRDIRICDIEERIKQLREVRSTETYITVDGTLYVYVMQRNPIMRITTDGGDYLLDDEGVLIPKRKPYAPRLHIAGGNINITHQMLDGVSVLDTSIGKSILKDIFYMVKYIRDDRFWSAQIDQIWIDSNNEINIIPRAGNHIIHLGSIENYIEKLENLEAFYLKILPLTGWNTYKKIDLEYKDQIVCNKNQ